MGRNSPHHAEAVPRHRHDAPHRPQPLEPRVPMVPRGREREQEEPDADREHDREARERPVRDLRGREHPDDENPDRDEIEDPVGEDGADERRPESLAAVVRPPGQDGDARELADAARQHRVREQPDRERREDEPEAGVRRRHRRVDHRVPRGRPRDDREEIEPDRGRDPLPVDGGEGVLEVAPVRPVPPEQRADPGEERERDPPASPRGPRDPHLPLHAATSR